MKILSGLLFLTSIGLLIYAAFLIHAVVGFALTSFVCAALAKHFEKVAEKKG